MDPTNDEVADNRGVTIKINVQCSSAVNTRDCMITLSINICNGETGLLRGERGLYAG